MTVAESKPIKNFRLVSDHVDLGPDNTYHQWVEVGQAVYLDSIGRKQKHGGYHRWLRIICNNIDCRGEVLVNSDAVSAEVAKWIKEK